MNTIIRKAVSLVIAASCYTLSYGQCNPELIINNPEILFDGPVNKFAVQDNYLYAGGSFNSVGKFTGGFTELNKQTGRVISFPQTSGPANGMPYGAGNMVVFGSFTKIKDTARTYLAIVDASGNLTAFHPSINAAVNAAVVYNGILYIGGSFTTVNGISRNRLAAFDMSTGALTNWDPNASNTGPLPCRIDCMIQSSGNIYVGGAFSNIGGAARKNIAVVDPTNGTAGSWAPQAFFSSNPNYGNVSKMLKVNNLLFICGGFDYAGGKTHGDVAAIDITTGISTNWRPDPNSVVLALANKGDTLYLGGAFYTISGLPRKGFAAYSIASGSLLPISINTSKIVTERIYGISVFGDTVFLGGVFDSIGNGLRKNVAAFNRHTGAIVPWVSHTNGDVYAVHNYNNRLFIGGIFYSADRKLRSNIAAIDLDADTVASWNLRVNGEVKSINPRGKTIYIGGNFTKVGDSMRGYNAAFTKATTKVLQWDPGADSVIYDIEQYNNDVYIGGTFSNIKGQPRNGLAKLDAAGNLQPWTAINGTGSNVYGLEVTFDRLYVGGKFTDLGGEDRTNLGSIDLQTGLASSWNYPVSPQYFMTREDYNIFIVNKYPPPTNPLYGPDSSYIVRIIDKPFAPSVSNIGRSIHYGIVKDIAFSSGRIYPVGSFNNTFPSTFPPTFRQLKRLGEMDVRPFPPPFQPGFTEFNPDYPDGTVLNTTVVYGNKLYVGGDQAIDIEKGYQNASLYQLTIAELEASAFTDTNGVCSGLQATVRVKSTVTYGVTYRWNVNGVNISNPSPYYTFMPKDKDSISCVVLSPATKCIVDAQDTTNSIVFAVTQTVIPDISITSVIEEESGKQVTVKATVKDAATGYSIEWFNKGVSIGKTTVDTFNYTKGAGTDSIYAVITPRPDTCYVTDTSGLIVVNEKPVGIGNITGDARVMVYPNPFDIYVKVSGLERGDVLILYDVTGRKISTGTSNSKEDYLLETGKLKTGVYVLKITGPNGMLRKSILIQKQ